MISTKIIVFYKTQNSPNITFKERHRLSVTRMSHRFYTFCTFAHTQMKNKLWARYDRLSTRLFSSSTESIWTNFGEMASQGPVGSHSFNFIPRYHFRLVKRTNGPTSPLLLDLILAFAFLFFDSVFERASRNAWRIPVSAVSYIFKYCNISFT